VTTVTPRSTPPPSPESRPEQPQRPGRPPVVPVPPPDESPTEMLPSAAGRHARPARTREERRAELLRKVRAHLPFLVVMLVVAVAFGRIALQHWREGTTELGVALLLAGVLRASLTRTAAGLLAVRSRRVDIVTYTLFGLVLIAVSLTITGGPLATR
jgi:Protein of unknown function (DUF3017)